MTQVAKGKQRLRRASIASDIDMLWWLLLILVLTGKGAVSSQLKHVRSINTWHSPYEWILSHDKACIGARHPGSTVPSIIDPLFAPSIGNFCFQHIMTSMFGNLGEKAAQVLKINLRPFLKCTSKGHSVKERRSDSLGMTERHNQTS